MSSLAAARADNFYIDPENPQKPTKKLKRNAEGHITIRFEAPFDMQCLGCQLSIGKGVRFNAEKFKAGNYHSSTVWGFRMKSPCCKTPIEIHTNPKEADYDVIAGARRKLTGAGNNSRGDGDGEGEGNEPENETGISTNAKHATRSLDSKMSRLEKRLTNERQARVDNRNLESIKELSYDRYGDDAARNRELRRSMRSVRDDVRKRERRRDELGLSREIDLLPETRMDRARASAVVFQGKTREHTLQKRKKIMKQGIFK